MEHPAHESLVQHLLSLIKIVSVHLDVRENGTCYYTRIETCKPQVAQSAFKLKHLP